MKLQEMKERIRLAYQILRGGDGNMVAHAKREFDATRSPNAGPMDHMMESGTIDLLRTLSTQGHSGFSIGFARQLFDKLSGFEPLSPLTGADAEWFDHGDLCDGTRWQNKRCGHVFKSGDGEAYDIDAVVFEEPSGARFVGFHSRMPVVFPYVPRSVTARVAEDATDLEKQSAASFAWAAA